MRRSRLWGATGLVVAACVAVASPARADVVINEVNCEGTDWVELANTGALSEDISGWLLTDHPLDSTDAGHKHFFPGGTEVDAGARLVVERSSAGNPGGFPFGISCGGDTVRLADGAGERDATAVPELTAPANTWGRLPDGTGGFAETLATKGAPNQPAGGSGPPGDPSWLFDPAQVVEIDLELPQSSIDALEIDPEEYQDATFSLRTSTDSYGPLAVGVRLKGQLGRDLTKKAAFKVKFNHSVSGQRFFGLRNVTLNNMLQDPSMLHELLAYEVFRAMGVPAPRTGYSYVTLNDADYGVYLTLETVDDVMLDRWLPTTQHLYEGEYGSDVDPGRPPFEVDEGSDSDLSDLEALAERVNATSPADFSDRVSAVADLDQMALMWAVEKYVSHVDSYTGGASHLHPNNFYIHSDAAGVFRMLPWGTDSAWLVKRPFWEDGEGVLFELCVADSSCAASYIEGVRVVRAAVPALDLDGLAARTAELLQPWQAIDPRRIHSLDEIADGVAATRANVADRPGEADTWLANPILYPPSPTAAGDTGGSLGTPGAVAPRVRLKRAPEGRIRKLRVSVNWSAEPATAGSWCKLNDGSLRPCSPPAGFRVGPGKHRIVIRAIEDGVWGPPEIVRFRVLP